MTTTEPVDEARAFLEALFPRRRDAAVVISTKVADAKGGTRWPSRWFSAREYGPAAAHAVREAEFCDVYVGVCLLDPNAPARKDGGRGKADDARVMAALWADLDVAGPAHRSDALPPDEGSALALLDELGLPPSLVVHSGHGLQPWWTLAEPLLLDGPEARSRGRAAVDALQGVLRAVAGGHGWTLDATSDLARVLRVPGTMNHKLRADPVTNAAVPPRPVRVVAGGTGERFALADVEAHLEKMAERYPPASANGSGPSEPGERLDPAAVLAGVPEGERDVALYKYSCSLRARRIDRAEAETLVLVAAARCSPPFPRALALRKVESAWTRPPGTSWEQEADADDEGETFLFIPPEVEAPPAPPEWPVLGDAAHHGLAGEVVRALAPHTEADPAVMLVELLAAFGNAVGAGPHVRVGGDAHPARLNLLVVGETGEGRKGTAWSMVRWAMRHADPFWVGARHTGGLSSGEGLITPVGDAVWGVDRKGNAVLVEPNVEDKRLLVREPEFAGRTLQAIRRDNNTLSGILREAYEMGPDDALGNLTKSPRRATGAHITIIGDGTPTELRAQLRPTDFSGGFAGRYLFVASRRSRLLPDGGTAIDEDELAGLGARLAGALDAGRERGRMRRSPAAEARWNEIYHALDADRPPGALGELTARAPAHMLRLSLAYALLDSSPTVEVAHLEAAGAVWAYCRASARYLLDAPSRGTATGDADADRLLEHLVESGRPWSARQLKAALSWNGTRVAGARGLLERLRLVQVWPEAPDDKRGGRPTTWCRAK